MRRNHPEEISPAVIPVISSKTCEHSNLKEWSVNACGEIDAFYGVLCPDCGLIKGNDP